MNLQENKKSSAAPEKFKKDALAARLTKSARAKYEFWNDEDIENFVKYQVAFIEREMAKPDFKKISLKDGNTINSKCEFLVSLGKTGCHFAKACKTAKISRNCAYLWIKKDELFAEFYEEVMAAVVDNVETALYRSALEGNVNAQIAFLKAKKPEVWNMERKKNEDKNETLPIPAKYIIDDDFEITMSF